MKKHLQQKQLFINRDLDYNAILIPSENTINQIDIELTKFILNKTEGIKIAFWDNSLSVRGTTVALYDYAYYNKYILRNESIILYNNTRPGINQSVVDKFKKEFPVFSVDNFDKVDNILKNENCDIFYIIKGGENENQYSRVIKTVVHCVFNCYQPHGNVYASIAPWVKGNNGKYPFVPHIMSLPDHNLNMREKLNISEDAIVYGRHGGYEQFDIAFVHTIVYNVAKNNPNIYFLFVNTKPFCDKLSNIIHLDPIVDLNEKVNFINTCDAMLWARSDGEVFSCSMGEFSIKNKPIICTKIGYPGHIELLKDQAIWYTENNLENILMNFNKNENSKKDWNAYKEYTPEKVIQQFKKVFIDND